MIGSTIIASAPTRLDFGGGWTDVPPYPAERGGFVCNLAIERRATVTLTIPPTIAPAGSSCSEPCPEPHPEPDLELLPAAAPGARGITDASRHSQRFHRRRTGRFFIGGCRAGRRHRAAPGHVRRSGRTGRTEPACRGGGPWRGRRFPGPLCGGIRRRIGTHVRRREPRRTAAAHRSLRGRPRALPHGGVHGGVAHFRRNDHGGARRLSRPRPTGGGGARPDGDTGPWHARCPRRWRSAHAALIDEHWQHQRSLHPRITTDRIDALEARVRSAGATGFKALGASGGGSVLICSPAEHAPQVRAAAATLGAVLSWRVARDGVRVEAPSPRL